VAEEWERYGNPTWELTTVRHITHVPAARRVIEDGKIKAGLVYDKSKLKTSRLSVSWVSANTWTSGSIYGTVEFRFDWKTLIEGQSIYWVEVIDDYNPPAYRLLLSKQPITSPLVKSYDPATAKGPLKLADDKWYWNGWNLTSEFMIADDLPLDKVSGLDFVKHHEKICPPREHNCDEMKNQPSTGQTGGKVLSYILGHGLHVLDKHLKPSEPPAQENSLFEQAYVGLRHALSSSTYGGALNLNESCDRATRGALALYGMDQVETARDLLSLIMEKKYFESALRRVVRAHFNTPAWTPKASASETEALKKSNVRSQGGSKND
jgi:hypothetical protein